MERLIKLTYLLIFIFSINNNIISQVWTNSFTAGNYDVNGKFLGGSEVLQLIGHKNKLFASVGYWQDGNNIWYGGTNTNIGWGQIIRLDGPNNSWKEDLFLGSSFLRPEILKQIIFTKDASGNNLNQPDTVLITAAYSVNYFTNTVTVKSFVRNDLNGNWEESQILQGGFPAGENYSIRDIEIYTDQITGLEYVFASVGTQGIYAGKYNPSTPGKINWISTPEISPLSIRPLGIEIANGNLFFSSGNKLYKRIDGTIASYIVAHDFIDISTNINSAVGGIRGLTQINNPNSNDQAFLLMWCPNGQSQGIIYRLEPDGNGGFNRLYETKLSLLVESYLPGSNVNYLLGAYNEFYQFIDPINHDTLHLVGFESDITGGGFPTWNGYYSGGLFVKRNNNMQYMIEEINGPIGLSNNALVANRCYVKSPFNNDNAIYFGGFDPNSNSATNMAWIYRKDYQINTVNEISTDKVKINIYPNPTNKILNIDIDEEIEVINIYNKIGEICFISKNTNIDLSELSKGIYIITIKLKSEEMITGKVVIE